MPWVAGCDGARSAVRELSGITFPGAPYEHVFFVADVEGPGRMVPDEVNVYLWREGFHLLFPMRGQDHWRIVGILPEELRGKDDVTFEAVIPSLRKEAGAELDLQDLHLVLDLPHPSPQRRAVPRPPLLPARRRGAYPQPGRRAGHEHRLAGRLQSRLETGAGCEGEAGEALLGTYEDERIPVARRLLNTTDRAFKLIVADNWLAGLFRTKILARIAAFALSREAIQEFAFRTVSQIGINYRNSSALEDTARPCLPPRPRRATASRGCGSSASGRARWRICTRSSTTRNSI